MEMLNTIIENSGISSSIIEGTETSDIANTDNMIIDLIKENYNTSLAYHIAEVIPMNTPNESLYLSYRDDNNFKVSRTEVATKINTMSTGFTQEVFQDMQKMFNKSAKNAAGKILAGVSAREENDRILKTLNLESVTEVSLTISDSNNLESVLLQLSKRVSELVIQMNRDTYKTLDSFCILDQSWAAALLGSFNYMTEGNEKSLFVGRVGRTDYYINPFPNTSSEFDQSFDYSYEIEATPIPNYCYVGLIGKTPGTSSLIFAPYSYEKQYITDPDTGDNVLNIRNRYGLIMNPQHKPLENRSMLYKFQIL